MPESQPAANPLRADRDRFVAFAFASSDLLLELDPALAIFFVAGASEGLLGRPSASLVGMPFLDIFAPEDRAPVRKALGEIRAGKRVEPLYVRLLGASGAAPRIVLTGNCIPDLGHHFYISLSAAPVTARSHTAAGPAPVRDRATGLHETASFGEVARARMAQARELGEEYKLTLLDMKDFERLRPRIDEEVASSLMATIGETLRASSVGGDSAGRLDGDKYGVVHRGSLSVEHVTQKVQETVRATAPEAGDFRLNASTVDLDAGAMTEEESARAIVYTLNKFRANKRSSFSITTLSEGCRAMFDETVERVAQVKKTIGAGDFKLVFQPIVSLADRRVHHYEALARDIGGDKNRSPFEFVTLAEEIGLITDFDLAVCQRAIETLEARKNPDDPVSVAVNLSGHSLGQARFSAALVEILKKHPGLAQRLLFEVTESAEIEDLPAANRVLQHLRRLGHAVCLDDFGAGAAAFEYLRSLEVDFVKIDGGYVKGATSTTYGRSFLKCIATLCGDLKVGTIAEMVEDEGTTRLLADVGVHYGQGYYFGKPEPHFLGEVPKPAQPALQHSGKYKRDLRKKPAWK